MRCCGKCGAAAFTGQEDVKSLPKHRAERAVWSCSNGGCGHIFQVSDGRQVTLKNAPWIMMEVPK